MSFLIDEFNFKHLDDKDHDLFFNIEEDLHLLIDNYFSNFYLQLKTNQEEDEINDFNLRVWTSKNTKDELYHSQSFLEIQHPKSTNSFNFNFNSYIRSLKIYISDNLDHISTLINKPLDINITYTKKDFQQKYNLFNQGQYKKQQIFQLYNRMQRLKVSSFLHLMSKHGKNISFDFEKKSVNYVNDPETVIIEPNSIKDDITKYQSYVILKKIAFVEMKELDDLHFSLPVFNLIHNKSKNSEAKDFFYNSLQETFIEYEKKQIFDTIEHNTSNIINKKRI